MSLPLPVEMLKSNLVNAWYPLTTVLNYPKRNARSGRCQDQQRGKKHSLMQRISARTKKPRLLSLQYIPKGPIMVKYGCCGKEVGLVWRIAGSVTHATLKAACSDRIY